MRRHRLVVTILLALAVLTAAAPLIGFGACEDDCSADCGDCPGCGLLAECSSRSSWRVGLASADLASPPAPSRAPSPTRALDHVPLPPVA